MHGLVSSSHEKYSYERMVSESFKIAELMENKFKERDEKTPDYLFQNNQMNNFNCSFEPLYTDRDVCKICGRPKYEHVIRNKK